LSMAAAKLPRRSNFAQVNTTQSLDASRDKKVAP
jgi:hypothetical protein